MKVPSRVDFSLKPSVPTLHLDPLQDKEVTDPKTLCKNTHFYKGTQ